MSLAAERIDFAPAPPPGMLRALVLALLAHALLLTALAWGVNWKHKIDTPAIEAELWSAVPQQAAPPPAPPAPEEPVAEPPKPVETPEADITLEKERQAKERRKQEAERLEQSRLDKAEKALKLAEAKRKEALAKQQELAEAKEQEKLVEEQRKKNLQHALRLAAATGAESSRGSALQSSGPSPSYEGRIKARIYPNIKTAGRIEGKPATLVQVRLGPDGTIQGFKMLKSSGVPAWDEAVLRALDLTGSLPRDADGRIFTPLEINIQQEQ